MLGVRLTDGLSAEVGLELLRSGVARAEVAAEAGDVLVATGRTARALVAERARGTRRRAGSARGRTPRGGQARRAGARLARGRGRRRGFDGEEARRRGQSGAGDADDASWTKEKRRKREAYPKSDLARRARDAGARASGREGCVDAPPEGTTRALVLRAAETANISLRGCGVKCARCRGTDISGSRRLRSSASHANEANLAS